MRLVVGVIGHVDHGKTALVGALTGMDTDRLAEEKRRGISIALGFAHLTAGGVTVDLIDMPGHERFVRTMVSGATGIDAALIVVAANEGIKPQTIEHLDIVALLGLRRAIIAVSKTDLVPTAQAEATAQAVVVLARQAGLAVCGTVLTSVRLGLGLQALRDALVRTVPSQPMQTDDGFPYLPIDRVFSIPGHGTVVTGTLRRGRLRLGEDVTIAPDGRRIRLRGLQVHGRAVTAAEPGMRLAANLRDVTPDQITRGVALTAPGMLPASNWLTVALRAVASAPAVPTSSRLTLLFGTEEIEARLRLLDCDELQPGQTALAQLHCALPVSLPAREHFILRLISPLRTIAGGRVIDPVAVRLRRHAPGVLADLTAIATAEPGHIVQLKVAAAGAAGVSLSQLCQLAGVSETRIVDDLRALPVVLGRSRVVVPQAAFEAILAAIPDVLADQELAPDRLTAMLPWANRAVVADAVAELVRRGTVIQSGGLLRRYVPQREQERASHDASSAQALAEVLLRGGLTPPSPTVIAPTPEARRLIDRLIKEGLVIRAVDTVQKREILFHQEVVETAKQRLAPLLSSGPGILVGEAGAALGISRKFCVPLLEHFDAIRFTRRVADRRVLAKPAGQMAAGVTDKAG